MLSQVLSGLTLVRHAVAITLVLGAAGATVASAVDVSHTSTVTNSVVSTTANTTNHNTTDLEAAVKACLGTKDPASDECAKAIELSGLSADEFWAKVALSLNEQLGRATNDKHDQKTEPSAKPENTNTRELIGLVTACVASHERSSEPCAKALSLSGLSADEFWAKVGAMFENKRNEPTTTPKTTEGLSVIIGACLAKLEAARNGGAYTEPISTSEACRKAYEASGLTPEQFWSKFAPKPSTTEKPQTTSGDAAALIKECVAAYERARQTHENGEGVSQICNKAIAASGLSSNDFWAKYYPKTTTTEQPKPSATPKPQPTQTVSDETLKAMVQDCFAKYTAATAAKGNEDLARAAYEACTKAIAASGLSGDAFWAKFGKPVPASN
jgi:hypothetical protein